MPLALLREVLRAVVAPPPPLREAPPAPRGRDEGREQQAGPEEGEAEEETAAQERRTARQRAEANPFRSLAEEVEELVAVSLDEYDSGDATWILTSAFIILTMQSGFGLLETGMVSARNEVNIMMKNVVDVVIGGLVYWFLGYGLSHGEPSNAFIGYGDFMISPEVDKEPAFSGYMFSKYLFFFAFASTATRTSPRLNPSRSTARVSEASDSFRSVTGSTSCPTGAARRRNVKSPPRSAASPGAVSRTGRV